MRTLKRHSKFISLRLSGSDLGAKTFFRRNAEYKRHTLSFLEGKVTVRSGTKMALGRKVEETKVDFRGRHIVNRAVCHIAQVQIEARRFKDSLVLCVGWDGIVYDDICSVLIPGIVEGWCALDTEGDVSTNNLAEGGKQELDSRARSRTSTRLINQKSKGRLVSPSA